MNAYGKTRRYVLISGLAVLVLVLVSCGGTNPTSEPRVSTAAPEAVETQAPPEQVTNTPEPTTVPTDAPEPTTVPTDTPQPTTAPTDTAADQSLYLGDIVEQDNYFLSAIAVEDPTTPGMFYEPESGKKLVAVEVILGNVSGESLSVNPLSATLLDSEGFTYQPELAGRDGQLATVDLSPGEKARGWIAFEMPEGATAAGIKYAIEIFGNKLLQTGLTAPPDGYVPDIDALFEVPSAPEVRFGDVFEQYGYSLSATAVEDPTTPGMLYKANEGRKLVAVEVVVGNVSGETLSVNPLNALLVDSNGLVYQPELAGRDGQIATVDLNAGEKVKGWIAFEVPEDVTPTSVKYSVEIFSDKFLQVGLTE